MKRYAEKKLDDWLRNARRKPLVIRGARQVGKSTLVRNFCKSKGLRLYEVNLERHITLADVFKSLDIEKIVNAISLILREKIIAEGGILFLDEIQAVPQALQALRYFYEEYPELPVICAGSLLEFALAKHTFSMPVGRIQYFFLGPMSFEEFLEAKGEEYLVDYLRNYSFEQEIPLSAHKTLLALQREYLYVGGMPEAVKVYCESRQCAEVADVHNEIMMTYQDDFAKYASQRELLRLHKVLNHAPSAVGKKVKYSSISSDDTSRDVKAAVELLSKAGLITKVCHSDCSGVPLAATIDSNTYKLLFLDIGLMNRMCGIDWQTLSMMDERVLVNEGALAEQFIGQQLLYVKEGRELPEIFYWLREKKVQNAEVDYAIAMGSTVIPIEVKAGVAGTLKSLTQCCAHKKLPFAVRFDLNLPSLQDIHQKAHARMHSEPVAYKLMSLPLYMVNRMTGIVEQYLSRKY